MRRRTESWRWRQRTIRHPTPRRATTPTDARHPLCTSNANLGRVRKAVEFGPTSARGRPMFTRTRPRLPEFGPDIGQNSPDFGQCLSDVDQTWYNIGQSRPTLARNGPESANIGPISVNVSPSLTKVGPQLTNFNQYWPGNGQLCHEFPASGPISALFGPLGEAER